MITLKEAEQLISHGDLAQQCWALRAVSRGRLYRPAFSTFADWTRHVSLGTAYAYRLIAAADVLDDLADFERQPRREAQVRPLVNLTTEQRRAVWGMMQTKGRITAAMVKEAAQQVTA